MNKTRLKFAVISIIGILLVFWFLYKYNYQSSLLLTSKEEERITAFSKMEVLPAIEESELQKKITDIISNGKSSDCETLTDDRYKFGCYQYFKQEKK